MNKISGAFLNRKAFIPFITSGDPSLEVTEQLVIKMAEAGADLIELGIPFSDPVAEGEVIQNASMRALAGGVTVDKIFDMVGRIRSKCPVPLILMTYVNPVFAYGTEKFFKNCKEAGVDGIIVPDLPYEEKGELTPFCSEYGITFISMIAPTSGSRIRMIAKEAEGFLYCVSSMGVTGVREHIGDEVNKMVEIVRSVTDIPCAVGFGVSTPEQAARLAAFADGVIVGSAIVKIIEKYGPDCIPYVVEYVRMMKNAVKNCEGL
ncbi:tryptophan synthase alpha chain [Thermoclostridium stercorarium subsp. stercorarium DSM 8532]|jgi:tryptophan synthase alpha chain|uniref:Tryptophan synthase alpha chain n=3 Tax=Thermoclostridium stercorarium TaxID=1510 RepID=L7VRF9_THES1|nr:tryptophan synthase subunit alpha [Thermoclostridium stercorarium]AGC68986.1 tryptophan synthase alpha chain [Thermoclostridium stercorarium subsp. stercorarium DSM 8532]AGI39965.1 tryptophan synthase alpha subunit [Thermoclostridium stercorarium subsp. stercorarium DSM 8532]ANW99285.1 tryptophan synthase subunit alpha [Thermoclostridium stercorarium subsp. thermolacticum DSM 2910]ANX01914.1 tryptophan synthase subunit alpha [Thermoclostridium stercorarium subsp. leptospartum DSM 9219]UZQ84